MAGAWAERLEKRLGFLEIPNLAAFMAGMNALSAVLTVVKPQFPAQLVLDPELLRAGQVWRAFTFVLVPPQMDLFPWLLFWLLLYYAYLSALQREWRDFKLTVYVVMGAAATALACLATSMPLGSGMFVTSLFLAFARTNPDFQVLLFFFFPVKMRWLGAVVWVMTLWSLVFGRFDERVEVLAGLVNYLAFFGPEHLAEARLLWRRQRHRR